MTTWREFEEQAPALAARVRERFAVRKHCTMATLRADGGPRISGTEVQFEDGELRLGSMPGAVKALDLLRDPRVAVHSATVDPPAGREAEWEGEAKVAGRAVPQVSDDASHRFAIDLTEVVLTHLDDAAKQLVITSWHPGRGVREVRRD
jgi:Pyridoxamine 5'-phosphate oxidase